jgi:adenosylhomocysteine nucleosidase
VTRLGIIAALPAEQRTLSTHRIASGEWIGLSDNTLLALSGAGPERAAAAGRRLIEEGVNALLSWGCAAGLESTLVPGSLVLPKTLTAADGRLHSVDSTWHQRLHRCLSERFVVHTGSVVESRHLVVEATEKTALFDRFRGIALDMESVAIAQLAAENGIPFVAIRTVADPADSNLPQSVAQAMDHRGDIDLRKLLWYTLAHPAEFPRLLRLGRHFHAAQRTLKRVARQAGASFLASPPTQRANRTTD